MNDNQTSKFIKTGKTFVKNLVPVNQVSLPVLMSLLHLFTNQWFIFQNMARD